MKKIAFLILLISFPISSWATMSASDLYERCHLNELASGDEKKKEGADFFNCLGYVEGFLDGYRTSSDISKKLKDPAPKDVGFCLPEDGITNMEAVMIFETGYETLKSMRKDTARMALIKLLRKTYPCKG